MTLSGATLTGSGSCSFSVNVVATSTGSKQGTTSAWIQKRDLRPTFECIKQDFGMSIAARRNYDANTLYWRVNQFILPFYTLVPPLSPFPDPD